MKTFVRKLTFWEIIAGLVLATGAYSTYVRFFVGLGASTNLSDTVPWGLWIGFGILCGVGLAASGFTLAAIVYIFNLKRFEPIVRPTILTAFLGYSLVIVNLLYEVGRPWVVWHTLYMWNDHSVLFEVAWCVMLYSTVLALEFSPVVFEQYKMQRALKIVKKVSIPLIILGVLLSTLHQSSLGSLFLIVPEKMYPLWYSPYLPVLFYVSAIGVGCAMIIIESLLSTRLTRKGLEMSLMVDLARAAVVMVAVSFTMRVVDLLDRGVFGLLFVPRMETYYYWAEIIVGMIAPFVMLVNPRIRCSRTGLMIGSSLIMIGFVLNRLDVCITSLQASWAPVSYFPSWMEFSISLSIVVAGFVIFATVAKYFPVFTNPEAEQHRPELSEWDLDLALVSGAEVGEPQNGIHA